MKTTGFFNKRNFHFGILMQLFRRAAPVEKSSSIEDLQAEISTTEYRQKLEYLIKQDLLQKYDAATVEQVLNNFSLHLIPINTSDTLNVEEEEPLTDHIEPEPEVQEREHEILTDERKQEVWKVHSRVPGWFRKPHQINSRILIAYMDLLGENKSVPLHKLESACRSIKTFQNNYVQMKSFGERNHAKVFEEAGGRITLWEPVREFVKQEFRKFKKRNNNYY